MLRPVDLEGVSTTSQLACTYPVVPRPATPIAVGELPRAHYQQLRDAGADRYLLRIESSNPELYASLHPPAQKWEHRVQCLRDLKDIGFMVGGGVGAACIACPAVPVPCTLPCSLSLPACSPC